MNDSDTRPNGISVLMASQNAIRTVEKSVLSNLPLADEMIAVDNGSTDGTVEVLERLASKHDKLTFINAPDVVHLYENRQIAFERSKYRWIVRCDSDFIAWRAITDLRKLVLETQPRDIPIGFELMAKYVVGDWQHTKDQEDVKVGRRIYQHMEGMSFGRLGRWEGPKIPGFDPHKGWFRVLIDVPYWLHASIKAPIDRLLRIYRTEWRAKGDFETYPTVESYVRMIAPGMFSRLDEWEAGYIRSLDWYMGEYPEIIGEDSE